MNGERPDDQETYAPHPRTAAEKYTNGLISHPLRNAMVVDGHFKTQFSEEDAANKAASELLANFPMLQVEIYNAKEKSRMLVKELASR